MQVKDVVRTLERFAPLPLQESYDNAGLQIGLTDEQEVSGVLLCLDVTEDIIIEAIETDCNMIVSHHPLFFRPIRRIAEDNMVGRCTRMAIQNDIAIYSAHTNLDNVEGGVNYEMAERLGLKDVYFLRPMERDDGGSGVIGVFPEGLHLEEYLDLVQDTFKVETLMHNDVSYTPHELVKKVAICGGAGDFLLEDAVKIGADAFITGEMGYHKYFNAENRIVITVLGHYQSEQYTIDLLEHILQSSMPELRLFKTGGSTNPIHYRQKQFRTDI